MTAIDRIALGFAAIVAVIVALFLLAPLVVAALVSFSSSPVFGLPAPSWTLDWYAEIWSRPGFFPALMLSVQVALVSTAIALVLGTLAAIALVRGRMPGGEAIATFLVSPLMLPGIVVGIAMLQFFRALGLYHVTGLLIAAHVVITLPYVVRTVMAGLVLFDFSLLDAARTLGCTPAAAVRRVMIPALAPSFFAAGLFAFLASMDNYPVSIFLTDARTKTLPIRMIQYVDERPDPTIAAISTGLIVLTLIIILVGGRLVGLRRIASV